MAHIKTSKGFLKYESKIPFFGDKVLDKDLMLDNIRLLAAYLDKIDINWGPAFGTLIGIVRNNDFQPWKPVFDIYILKEGENEEVEVKGKQIALNRLHIGNRDTKGVKK